MRAREEQDMSAVSRGGTIRRGGSKGLGIGSASKDKMLKAGSGVEGRSISNKDAGDARRLSVVVWAYVRAQSVVSNLRSGAQRKSAAVRSGEMDASKGDRSTHSEQAGRAKRECRTGRTCGVGESGDDGAANANNYPNHVEMSKEGQDSGIRALGRNVRKEGARGEERVPRWRECSALPHAPPGSCAHHTRRATFQGLGDTTAEAAEKPDRLANRSLEMHAPEPEICQEGIGRHSDGDLHHTSPALLNFERTALKNCEVYMLVGGRKRLEGGVDALSTERPSGPATPLLTSTVQPPSMA
ncbi:hypothetical protein B0H16DRAFT_1787203 [Mycena metata]|uniref:Uncharacterized protein n=1 Tax=Mycena metata TaxID=1033252 RepID=A0AAD7JN54_9AGAR|nr:hypothetical protein B0H16DRAFT_1787203 [Mycena metata]